MAENSNDKKLVKTKYNIPKVGIDKFYDQPLTIKETKYDGNLQADAIRDVGGLEPILAANQTGWDEAMNGITRGVVSGLATAVEDFAYIPNIFTQDFEANALAQAMKDVKEDLREALPIYRSGDNPFSWDSEMFWESTAGVLDSGIGFAIPGIGIAKGVSLAGKAISKAGRLGKLGARTAALRESALGNPLLKRLSTSTIAGAISNDLEGTMMGVEIYENKVKELIDKRNNGELQATDEQIKNVAHNHAANFKLHNRAFAITDAFALQGLTRGHGITRNLITNPKNFKNKLTKALTSPDSLLAQGVTEGAEEIAQGVMQKMAEFNIDEELGLVKDDKGAFKRAIEYALDRETLYEGMLGFFGGGFQRVLSSSSNKAADFLHDKKIQKKIKNLQGLASVEQDPDKKEIYESRIKDLERERSSFKRENEYNRQQKVIDGIEEELASVVGKEVNLSEVEAYFDGDSPGDKQMQQLIRDVKFRNISLRHFENGTTEKLEESLANIEDSEERAYYQSKLKTYEKFYINHSGSSVNDLLFSAYSDIEMLQDKVKAIDTMIEQVKADENIVDEDLVTQFEEKKSVFQEQLEKAREDYKKIKTNDKEVLADILNKKVKEFLDAENEKQVDEIKEDHKRDGFDTSEAAEEAKTNVRDKQDRGYSKDSQPPPADQFEPGFEDDITSEPPQTMTEEEAAQAAEAQMDLDRQRAEGPPKEAPSEEEILSQPSLDPKASANEPPVTTPSGAEPDFDSKTAEEAKVEDIEKSGKGKILSAKFTGQGTEFEIEIQGDKRPFLLVWNRNNPTPSLFGEKQSDGSYKSTEQFPSKEQIQKLVDKYVPKNLVNLINEWTAASKLPSEQVLDAQEEIEKRILSELAKEEVQPKINIATKSSDEIISELNKLETFQEKLNWLKENDLLEPINIDGKDYLTVDYKDRVMVLMKVGNINMPFYISTGQAGKKGVPKGKWYAVFGIGQEGWINKGKDSEIVNQYDRRILQKIAKILNESIGPLESRENNNTGKLKEGIGFVEDDNKEQISSINSQTNFPTQPADNNKEIERFYEHVKATLKALDIQVQSLLISDSKTEPAKPEVTEEKLSDNEKQAFEDTELGQESTTNEDDTYVETEEASNVQDKGTKLFDQRDLPLNVNPEDSVFSRFFNWLRTWSQQKDAKLSDFRIKFELSFDENLYSPKNKELAKSLALLAKQSQTLNTENLKKLVDNVTIKAVVVRADGTSVVEGEEVFTTLRLPTSERPETLYPFREDIIKRLLSGQDAITEIQGQYAMGFDNQPTQDGLAPENSLEIFYNGDINEIEGNIRIGNSGRNNDGSFTTSSETRWLTLDSNDDIDLNARSDSSIAGKIGMKVRNPNGSYSVAKLNVKKIDDAAADLIFDAYKSAHAKFKEDGVKGLGYPPPNDLVKRLQDIVGFEYKPKTMLELMQFFVHDGSFRTKEGKKMYNTETKIVLREGALSFGEQELTDFDNPSQIEEFKNFLKEKKRFNIRRGKIFPNKQMRTNYIQWLVDNKILNTDLSPQIFAPQQNFSGSIFAKPFTQEKVAPVSKPTTAQTEVVKKLDDVVEPSKEESKKYLDSKDFFGKQDTSNSEDFTEDQISRRLKNVIADFFNGKLKRQYSDQTDTPYFESESVFNAFIDRLEAIKQELHAEGSIVYPKPVTLTDESAGLSAQPEILIVKSDGTVSILSFDVFKARPDKMPETANGRKRLQRRKDELNLQRIIGLNMGLNMGNSKVKIFRIGYGLQKFSVSSVEQTDSQPFKSQSQVTNNEKRTYAVKVQTQSESTASKNEKLPEKPAGEKLINETIDKVNKHKNPQDAKAFEKGLRKDWETYSESEEEYLRSFDIGIIGFYQYLVENFGFSKKATPKVDVENNQIVIGKFIIEGTDLESIDMAQVLIDKNAGLVKRSIRKRERLSQEAKDAPKSVPPAAPSAAPPTRVGEPPVGEPPSAPPMIQGEIKEESEEYKEAVEKLEEERKQAFLDHEEKWNRKAMSAAEDGENIYRPESPEEQDEWQQYGHPKEREQNEIVERFEKQREKLDKSFKDRNQKDAQSDNKARIDALKNRNKDLSARKDESTKDNLTDPDNNQKC